MIITPYRTTLTVAVSSASVNTISFTGEARLIYVKAPSDSTRFDFKLVDKNDDTPYHKKRIIGALRERESILLDGKYTATVENATSTGSYVLMIQLRETVQ